MKLAPVTRIGPDATPTAAPSMTIGDAIYYRHKARGVAHGTVAAVGKHGVTTDCEGEEHQVAWDQYLGHRQRATRRLTIVDRGEDGSIMEDEDGKRVYVRGSLDDYLPESKDDPGQGEKPMAKAAPLLIDIGDLEDHACDCALETLHKALAEDPSEASIWRPHENPYLAPLVEQWTADGQGLLQEVQAALLVAIGSDDPHQALLKAVVWSPVEVAMMRARLAKPLTEYTPDDWIDLVNLIFQTRLKLAVLNTLSGALAVKAALAGLLQALVDGGHAAATPAEAVTVMHQVATAAKPPPDEVTEAARKIRDWAKARIGVNLQSISDRGRAMVSRTILNHIQAHGTDNPAKLEQALFDDLGTLNRDWRSIAVTEAGEVANLSYLAQFPSGTKVKRIEQYATACPFCRSIDNRVFTWSTEPRPDSDGWTHVWPGKTNVGRSASPRKKTDDGLVERLPSEMWWPAAGTQHSHCRGSWLALPDKKLPPGVDPKFAAWLEEQFANMPPVR